MRLSLTSRCKSQPFWFVFLSLYGSRGKNFHFFFRKSLSLLNFYAKKNALRYKDAKRKNLANLRRERAGEKE